MTPLVRRPLLRLAVLRRERRGTMMLEFLFAGVLLISMILFAIFYGLRALQFTLMESSMQRVGRLCSAAAFLDNELNQACSSAAGILTIAQQELPEGLFESSRMSIISRAYETLAEASEHVPCSRDQGLEAVETGEGLFTTYELLYSERDTVFALLPFIGETRIGGAICAGVLVYREGGARQDAAAPPP